MKDINKKIGVVFFMIAAMLYAKTDELMISDDIFFSSDYPENDRSNEEFILRSYAEDMVNNPNQGKCFFIINIHILLHFFMGHGPHEGKIPKNEHFS